MELFGMNIGTIALLLSGALTVTTSVFGTKMTKYYHLLKQVIDMVEDGEVTKEELQKVVKRFKNL
jgi:hypothetical protein